MRANKHKHAVDDSRTKCPECNKPVAESDKNKTAEELFCRHCKKWVFYGSLNSEKVNGGTLKPDNVTELLKMEYDGKTNYRL